MRLKAPVILLSLPICSPLLLAQNQYNLSQFANETVDFIKRPARWDGNDWLRLGLVGAAISGYADRSTGPLCGDKRQGFLP